MQAYKFFTYRWTTDIFDRNAGTGEKHGKFI